jgi:hypothetical protein
MSGRLAARIGILAAACLVWGCGGSGGSEKTTLDLNGSYEYTLTPGSLSGNGALDCNPTNAATGTVDVTWTTGSNQCTVVVDSEDTYPASVHGNTISYVYSDTDVYDCPTYQETFTLHMTSATEGTGTIVWHCSWTVGATPYTCSATDALTVTKSP